MKTFLRLTALLLALFTLTASGPCRQPDRDGNPIESPSDCRCRHVGKRRVCNSACENVP